MTMTVPNTGRREGAFLHSRNGPNCHSGPDASRCRPLGMTMSTRGRQTGPERQLPWRLAARRWPLLRSLHLLVAVLLAAPLAAQDLPAPGDYTQAADRAAGYYFQAMDIMSETIEDVRADNLTSLRLSAFSYSRVMPILTVWHGRACWKADYDGANVAYPAQTVMGEMLGTLGTAQAFLATGQLTEANMEDLRATFVQLLQGHGLVACELEA